MNILRILLEHRRCKFHLARWVIYPLHYQLAMMPNLIILLVFYSHVVQETLLPPKIFS